jgi:dipeptidyl aminopeptidase/acylaminoacyl peptidase
VWRQAGAAAVTLLGLTGAAHAAPLPIKTLFAQPISRGAQISPSGRYLVLVQDAGGHDEVGLVDLSTHRTTRVLAPKGGRGVDWVRWKGDDRIVAGLAPAGHATPPSDDAPVSKDETIVAMDRDGGRLVTVSASALIRPGQKLSIADTLSRDPSHVLVLSANGKGGVSLWKVDIGSGSAEFVRNGRDPQGDLPGTAMVVRYDHRAGAQDDFDVLGPADGPHRDYVALQPRTAADGDTASLRIYDADRKTYSDPLWPALSYDVTDVVYHDGDKALAGVCYTADTYTCQFSNAALEADYRTAEAFFEGRGSLAPLSMSDDGRYWLFDVQSPTIPGAYYVLDRKAKQMVLASDRHPEMPSAKLGQGSAFTYRTRDGAEITGYVTRPPGASEGQPLPMIVMPHGGPEARDTLTFDTWAQFFATRGYLVFQPNFRGSSGFGRKFVEAGYGQWGGRMDNDITDGVRQLIQGGQVDKSRICIFGASFGGYAALFGGAQTPELYKCVASFAGVADLKSLVNWEHATPGHMGRYLYALRSIGDPNLQAAKLKAASPITYVAGYKPPVLLIHGADDHSVPVAQSQMMARALKRAGKDVRLVVYPNEGHTDWAPVDEQSALVEIEAFVSSHIGPHKPAA